MKMTHNPPTKPGWYWYEGIFDGAPYPVQVVRARDFFLEDVDKEPMSLWAITSPCHREELKDRGGCDGPCARPCAETCGWWSARIPEPEMPE